MREAKQILVIRKDLKMRRGKECAQSAHASLGAILQLMSSSSYHGVITRELEYSINSSLAAWLEGPFKKVTVTVNSEEELVALETKAKEAGIVNCMITDSGRTEFNNVPTKTVLAIGPAWEDEINPITGHLPLY
jgi:PTH2 family peptidyl-tRNA hydrolase